LKKENDCLKGELKKLYDTIDLLEKKIDRLSEQNEKEER
jgi:hypothetical protein